MHEFDLISKYFQLPQSAAVCTSIRQGIGDDAAILLIRQDEALAVTVDTLVAGTHFLPDTHSADVAYKALAVNLSDLAAMGAKPRWATLALTLPTADHAWLAGFADEWHKICADYAVHLIGGDLCRGPLSVTVQIQGVLPIDQAMLRTSARPEDLIYVTGSIGDAALGLAILTKQLSVAPIISAPLIARLLRPTPRVAAGEILRQWCRCAIDLSDGLYADLDKICQASGVGADLKLSSLPRSVAAQSIQQQQYFNMALGGGDDYELCFTIAPQHRTAVESALAAICPVTCIGQISATAGIRCRLDDGSLFAPTQRGYTHF